MPPDMACPGGAVRKSHCNCSCTVATQDHISVPSDNAIESLDLAHCPGPALSRATSASLSLEFLIVPGKVRCLLNCILLPG